jgi:hypothetical protein
MLAKIVTSLLVFISAGTEGGAPQQAIGPTLIPAPLTKLEALAAKSGTLLATETYALLRIYGEKSCNIRLQVIIMYEVGREAEKLRGLRVEIADPAQKETVTAYIDLDELENLSKAISSMLDLNQKGTSFTNPASKELFFSSTGGVRVAMLQRDTEKELVVSNTFAPGSCVVNRETSVVELKTAIDKVREDLR